MTTGDERREAKRLRAEGLRYWEIARQMGVTEAHVAYLLHKTYGFRSDKYRLGNPGDPAWFYYRERFSEIVA